MTSKVILPETDWMVLHHLACGTAVVQYGTGDGTDTARLAETANMVISLAPQGKLSEQQHAEWYEQWTTNVHKGLVGIKSMMLRAPWPDVSSQLVADSFGLAFVYPSNLGAIRLEEALNEAQRVSRTVAVAVDQLPYRVAPITIAAHREGWTVDRGVGLWVLRHRVFEAESGKVLS